MALAVSARADDPDIATYMQGRDLYDRNCALCHGARGDGKGDLAPTLSPRPRSFREGMFKFRSTPAGSLPTDDDLRRTITHGLSGTNMGKFDKLSPQEVDSLIAYLKFFSRRWRKTENLAPPLELPTPPTWLSQPAPDHTANGKNLYHTHCAPCHGANADGQSPLAPTLRDIWGQPTPPTDLRQPFPRCGPAPEDLYRLISTGMNGTTMPGYNTLLTPEQRWDLIAYLLSLRLPPPPTLDTPPAQPTSR